MKYLLKAFPIPLSMYFSLLTIRLLVVDSPWLEVVMGITLGLYIVSFLVTLTMNVIAKSTKTYHVKGLVTSSMLIKLVEIPAYTFIFLVAMLGILSVHFAPVIWIICFVFNAFCILLSGLYATAGITKAYSDNIITKSERVLYTILSFIFVIDVICSILLYQRVRREYT